MLACHTPLEKVQSIRRTIKDIEEFSRNIVSVVEIKEHEGI